MNSSAMFSYDRKFRFWLLREWDPQLPKVAFIGLNPSTADETEDDPTIRRCLGFARAWGKGGLLMLNLYAYRATLPADMRAAARKGTDIIGGQRNWVDQLKSYAELHKCDLVIAAWGAHGEARGIDVKMRWPGLKCLALNKDGTPKHPLYLKSDLQPIEF